MHPVHRVQLCGLLVACSALLVAPDCEAQLAAHLQFLISGCGFTLEEARSLIKQCPGEASHSQALSPVAPHSITETFMRGTGLKLEPASGAVKVLQLIGTHQPPSITGASTQLSIKFWSIQS